MSIYRRNKIMNYFSVMVRKRMKNDGTEGEEEVEKTVARKGGKKSNSISQR